LFRVSACTAVRSLKNRNDRFHSFDRVPCHFPLFSELPRFLTVLAARAPLLRGRGPDRRRTSGFCRYWRIYAACLSLPFGVCFQCVTRHLSLQKTASARRAKKNRLQLEQGRTRWRARAWTSVAAAAITPRHVNPASFWRWRNETNHELDPPLLCPPRKVADGVLPFAGKHRPSARLRVRTRRADRERVQDAVSPFLGQSGANLTVHLIRPSCTLPLACSLIRCLQPLAEAEKQQEEGLTQVAATPLIKAAEPVG